MADAFVASCLSEIGLDRVIGSRPSSPALPSARLTQLMPRTTKCGARATAYSARAAPTRVLPRLEAPTRAADAPRARACRCVSAGRHRHQHGHDPQRRRLRQARRDKPRSAAPCRALPRPAAPCRALPRARALTRAPSPAGDRAKLKAMAEQAKAQQGNPAAIAIAALSHVPDLHGQLGLTQAVLQHDEVAVWPATRTSAYE